MNQAKSFFVLAISMVECGATLQKKIKGFARRAPRRSVGVLLKIPPYPTNTPCLYTLQECTGRGGGVEGTRQIKIQHKSYTKHDYSCRDGALQT